MPSYCLECEWAVKDNRVADRTAAVIEHAVETDHDIDSVQLSLTREPPRTPLLN